MTTMKKKITFCYLAATTTDAAATVKLQESEKFYSCNNDNHINM